MKFFKIPIYSHVKNSHTITWENSKKNPKIIQSKNQKIRSRVLALGNFLQNFSYIYRAVSEIQLGTDGRRTDGRRTDGQTDETSRPVS